MAVQGRLVEAELELHGWTHQPHAPAAARVMLAAMQARRGELDAARQTLGDPHRKSPRTMDAAEAQLAVSVLLASGLDDDARRLGAWLYHLHGNDPAVTRWLSVMDVPGLTALPEIADATVERLGDELSARPELVTSLVYAFKQQPQSRNISLLRSATAGMISRFAGRPEEVFLSQGLAELALLLGDDDDARRWAHRTLRLDPFNASMALLLSKLADDEEIGPKASQVLKQVTLKFPTYPDVKKAYEQRLEYDQRQVA